MLKKVTEIENFIFKYSLYFLTEVTYSIKKLLVICLISLLLSLALQSTIEAKVKRSQVKTFAGLD